MANIVQKLIYYFSAITPIGVVFSVVWLLQKDSLGVPIIIISIAILLILCFGLSFCFGKNNLATIDIQVTNVSANDVWLLGYILSYLLPLAGLVIEEWNFIVLSIVAVLLGIVMPFMNTAMPHPLLAIRKYHFYQVATENGVSSYILISKRHIRNKREIKVVSRIFEFLLIEK